MFKILKANSDCYISNRIIENRSCQNSNVGKAGTLDLFKIYDGSTKELSRILLNFDLSDLKKSHMNGEINLDSSNFFAKIKLFDVYGGQTTPENFTINLNPLASYFSEGLGKDIAKYEDIDVANFLTSSKDINGNYVTWIEAGCAMSGSPGDLCDFYTGSLFEKNQHFITGEEDLEIDVTDILKSILREEILDAGWRLSFTPELESNNQTYFVKRFASRHAFDESKRPQLIYGFDDSIKDTSEFLFTDINSSFVFRNIHGGTLKNYSINNIDVEGENCFLLKATIPPSGTYYFTGSQVVSGLNHLSGTYQVDVIIPKDASFIEAQRISGSNRVKTFFELISLDESKTFAKTERHIFEKYFYEKIFSFNDFTVSTMTKSHYEEKEYSFTRVNVFNPNSPAIIASRVGVPSPGGFQGIIQDAYYRIRDSVTNTLIIPFDFINGSTKLSSDSQGMYFYLDSSNLLLGRSYIIDVAIKTMSETLVYTSTSPVFKIIK